MAEKRGQYVYHDDGSVSSLVSIAGAEDSGSGGALQTTTNDILPMEVQARYATTIQTHSGVSILPNTWNNGAWVDSYVDGAPLTYLGISINMTSGTGMTLVVGFSHDGVNYFSETDSIYDGTSALLATKTDIELPARYFRFQIKNKDATNPKTTTVYAQLKA
jgi:hypothetical protein